MNIFVLFTHVFIDTDCLFTEYGMNCPVPCSNNCIGMCSHVTGHCEAGCQAGWRGPTCDTSRVCLIVSFFFNQDHIPEIILNIYIVMLQVKISNIFKWIYNYFSHFNQYWKMLLLVYVYACIAWVNLICLNFVFKFIECDGGRYGQNCSEICGGCHGNEQCHHIDGTCPNGCNRGYSGDRCTQSKDFNLFKNSLGKKKILKQWD